MEGDLVDGPERIVHDLRVPGDVAVGGGRYYNGLHHTFNVHPTRRRIHHHHHMFARMTGIEMVLGVSAARFGIWFANDLLGSARVHGEGSVLGRETDGLLGLVDGVLQRFDTGLFREG